MKQLLATVIFALMALVGLSGAVPNTAVLPPLERAAYDLAECVHLR